MKQLIQDLARRLGYTVIPNWRLPSHPNAEYLRQLFSLLRTDCVLDVGANRGQYRDFLRRHVGYSGLLLSFEPIPELYDDLVGRSRTDPNWRVYPYALGSRGGTASFNVMESPEFSSFLEPSHERVDRFRAMNRVAKTVQVEVRTLDSVLPEVVENPVARSIFLKLDTQGYDLEVLGGAVTTLPNVKALSTEVSLIPIYSGMPDFPTVLGFLQAKGFVTSGIFPNNAGHFPLLVEFDLYMIAASYAGNGSSGAPHASESNG